MNNLPTNISPDFDKELSLVKSIIEQYSKNNIEWTIEMISKITGISTKRITELLVYTSNPSSETVSLNIILPSPEEVFLRDF